MNDFSTPADPGPQNFDIQYFDLVDFDLLGMFRCYISSTKPIKLTIACICSDDDGNFQEFCQSMDFDPVKNK